MVERHISEFITSVNLKARLHLSFSMGYICYNSKFVIWAYAMWKCDITIAMWIYAIKWSQYRKSKIGVVKRTRRYYFAIVGMRWVTWKIGGYVLYVWYKNYNMKDWWEVISRILFGRFPIGNAYDQILWYAWCNGWCNHFFYWRLERMGVSHDQRYLMHSYVKTSDMKCRMNTIVLLNGFNLLSNLGY